VRTTVFTSSADPDDPDEFPASFGTVEEDGTLRIVTIVAPSSIVQMTYAPGAWSSYEVTAEAEG